MVLKKIKKTTRCAVSARKRKCTSFLRALSRLLTTVEELDVGSSGIVAVRGPTRVFKKVTFMFESEFCRFCKYCPLQIEQSV